MKSPSLAALLSEVAAINIQRPIGRIGTISGETVSVSGLSDVSSVGDLVRFDAHRMGEVIAASGDYVTVLPEAGVNGLALNGRVVHLGACPVSPDDSWIGRIVDPLGRPLDDRPLMRGMGMRPLNAAPPPAAQRRMLGERLETGMAAFNTVLPLVRGQRVGLFAGSGVGKSTLLGNFALGVNCDVAVIALIGERGREVREFVEKTLGPDGMARSVVVAATSDQSPIMRRRAAWLAMTVAEYFRDQGNHVLFLADSVTRFAEAHREVALAAGEKPALRGYPPSTAQMIMALAERAGPGVGSAGDITAILSVLVAGSDMEEPIADILRGVLDGHIVLDRQIAERGRYPAIDLLRSVSRSLPSAASPDENRLIALMRHLLGSYDRAEMMIQAGLYSAGSDPAIDLAIRAYPLLDNFLAETETATCAESFTYLSKILEDTGAISNPEPSRQSA